MISILIPCFNEEQHIENCLKSVLSFEVPENEQMEVLVLDGCSTDKTKELVKMFAKRYKNVRLLDNSRKIQSSALNLGIRESKGGWIMRLDAHAQYPSNYLKYCLNTALKFGADNVGGICITYPGGKGYGAQLVQALTTHRFGVGNSGFRTTAKEGSSDTVPFGFFRRDVFSRIGYFDERLVRTQDFEFNRRLIASGGSIYMNPVIQSSYFNLPGLWIFLKKQLVHQGPYNAYMWYLAPYAFVMRHAVTVCFASFFWCSLFLAAFSALFAWFFLMVMILYFSIGIISSIQQAWRYRIYGHLFCLPFCFFLFHLLHGTGVLHGLLRIICRTAPVLKISEPWPGAGKFRAWP